MRRYVIVMLAVVVLLGVARLAAIATGEPWWAAIVVLAAFGGFTVAAVAMHAEQR